MRDNPDNLSAAWSHERVFRDAWLPTLLPGQDFSQLSLPLLQDLYPDVYRYGPYVQDWYDWADALEAKFVTPPGEDELAHSEGVIDMLQTLADVYESGSEIGHALHGIVHHEAYHYGPKSLMRATWAQPVWTLSLDEKFARFTHRVYDAGLGQVGLPEISGALGNVARLILLQYMPVTPSSQWGRAKYLGIHNFFSELFGLPRVTGYEPVNPFEESTPTE